jgi:hypothetical protein
MGGDLLEKYSPWVAGAINLLLSGLGSYNALIITPVAGLETPSIYVAVVGALISSVLGFVLPHKAALILLAVLFVPAIAAYHQLLSRSGATTFQLYFALGLYFFMYVVIFYLLAAAERFFVRRVTGQ